MSLVFSTVLAACAGWLGLLVVVAAGPRGSLFLGLSLGLVLVVARRASPARRMARALGLMLPFSFLLPVGVGSVALVTLLAVELMHLGTKLMPARTLLGCALVGSVLAWPLVLLAFTQGGWPASAFPNGMIGASLVAASLAGFASALGEWWLSRAPSLRHALERN